MQYVSAQEGQTGSLGGPRYENKISWQRSVLYFFSLWQNKILTEKEQSQKQGEKAAAEDITVFPDTFSALESSKRHISKDSFK